MFTENELKLRADKALSNETIIEEQIRTDIISEFKQSAYNGIMYYKRKNTYIANIENIRTSDLWATNHKCGSGFFKKIVDQKISYLLGKPIVVSNADNCNKTYNINKILKKTAKESAKKGVEWLHPYIDRDGKFNIINISGQECIPVWDTEYENELQMMIRYYYMTVVEGDKQIKRYRVELWDKEKVTYYMQDEEGSYYLDVSVTNPVYHYHLNTMLGDSVISTENYGWGKVPFIPLWNSDDKVNDLEAIKPDIDLYDVIKSDFANNIDRYQEAILVVKNHSAESYDKFLEILKKYGVIEIDEDGEVSWLTVDIPVEARKTFLEIIRDDIFEFGQAVDTRRVADGNTTNVVIKSRYADLDLKADDLESMCDETIREVYWFINEYNRINSKGIDNLEEMEIAYNRNIIFNTVEMIDNVLKSKGIVSDETALGMHPEVDDVEEEMKKIEADEKKNMEKMNELNGDPFEQNNKPGNLQEKQKNNEI